MTTKALTPRATAKIGASLMLLTALGISGCSDLSREAGEAISGAASSAAEDPIPSQAPISATPTETPSTAIPEEPATTPTADDGTIPGEKLDAATLSEATAALATIETIEDIPSADPDSSTYDERIPEYDRIPQFGQAWSDDHSAPGRHNGCDTRNDVLIRQLDEPTMRDDSGCVVQSGTYIEPYFGTEETFTRGEPQDEQEEIDHVISLSQAWYTGAWDWDQDKRVSFANDLKRNLLLTTHAANAGGNDVDDDGYKDRKDLGEYPGKMALAGYQWIEWLPDTNRSCQYAARYTMVADYYDLPILEQDKEAFEQLFEQC